MNPYHKFRTHPAAAAILLSLVFVWSSYHTGAQDEFSVEYKYNTNTGTGRATDAGADNGPGISPGIGGFVIMCWNVENYFDPFDDAATRDEDFTPKGRYHWTWKKFLHKRNSIAKTIISSAQEYGTFPSIVGLEEVENRMVLNQLVNETPLAKLGYEVVHRDSPDARGVDVALIYRTKDFKPLKVEAVRIESDHPTRDILYVKGVAVGSGDTLHILVNHWPSKLGGEAASQRRLKVAGKVCSTIDSISGKDIEKKERANIIVMGDFNDTPSNVERMMETSRRKEETAGRQCQPKMVNLAVPLESSGQGTLRYKGLWELIDQMIVSLPLAQGACMTIYTPDFLVEDDKAYLGKKPMRTFIGPRYNGGTSDHLPIFITLPLIDSSKTGQ